MGSINIIKPLSTVLSSALINLSNFKIYSGKKLGMLGFEPGTARWEASMQVCYAPPPHSVSQNVSHHLDRLFELDRDGQRWQPVLTERPGTLLQHPDEVVDADLVNKLSHISLVSFHLPQLTVALGPMSVDQSPMGEQTKPIFRPLHQARKFFISKYCPMHGLKCCLLLMNCQTPAKLG